MPPSISIKFGALNQEADAKEPIGRETGRRMRKFERADAHLVSISERAGDFMQLRGAEAGT